MLLGLVAKALRAIASRMALGLLTALLLGTQLAMAQTEVGQPPPTADTIKQLLDRLTAAEARIQQLEAQAAKQAGNQPAATPQPGPSAVVAVPTATTAPAPPEPTSAPVPEPAPAPAEEESHDHMMTIPGGPVLHFRGFFDVDFDTGSVAQQLQFPLPPPVKSGFRAGEFDLLMTSQLSDKLSFLSELVFATDPTNTFALDIERFQLTYRPSKYFEISAGRFHTSFGYYNTAFHHGNWFSTATGRPFMYYFEDAGGVLPVHELGVTATGYLPSGKFNLHWIAEVGNGSSEFGSANFGDGVENFATDRNRKDVNFAVYIKPDWLSGLQVGGSFLTGDLIPSNGLPKVNQTISSAYAVFINPKWEFMNEAILLHHQITDGGRSYNSPLAYTQLAYRFGKYRPYFRFQEVNIPNDDPVTSFKGRYEGPSVGLRMDFFDYAAFKLQYNRVFLRDAAAQNGFEAQVAFTF
jgi:hypothetical protein